MIVRAAPREHHRWLIDRAGTVPSSGFRAIEAVDSSGRILGMVGYDGWTPNSVVASIALESPAALRRLLGPAFRYPFVEAGRGVLLSVVREDNHKSRRLVEHLGFTAVHTIENGWDHGVGLVVYEMRLEECRWLEAV